MLIQKNNMDSRRLGLRKSWIGAIQPRIEQVTVILAFSDVAY